MKVVRNTNLRLKDRGWQNFGYTILSLFGCLLWTYYTNLGTQHMFTCLNWGFTGIDVGKYRCHSHSACSWYGCPRTARLVSCSMMHQSACSSLALGCVMRMQYQIISSCMVKSSIAPWAGPRFNLQDVLDLHVCEGQLQRHQGRLKAVPLKHEPQAFSHARASAPHVYSASVDDIDASLSQLSAELLDMHDQDQHSVVLGQNIIPRRYIDAFRLQGVQALHETFRGYWNLQVVIIPAFPPYRPADLSHTPQWRLRRLCSFMSNSVVPNNLHSAENSVWVRSFVRSLRLTSQVQQ